MAFLRKNESLTFPQSLHIRENREAFTAAQGQMINGIFPQEINLLWPNAILEVKSLSFDEM
jgi:hypothetical protein